MGPQRRRLRGTSVLAAPLVVVAVMALSSAVASLLWVASGNRGDVAVVAASIVVPAAVGIAALGAIRGCFVEIGPPRRDGSGRRESGPDGSDDEVRDVAGWITLRRIPHSTIATARVRRGPWRLYVVETDDGCVFKLVGASPLQFPSTLLSDAREHDLGDLDLLLGADPDD